MKESPILLITFNRPKKTKIVFEAIKMFKPSKLYVFNDGGRVANKEDKESRKQIKKIIEDVDWDCELFTNYSKKNLGCGKAVTSAISWAFTEEDRLIILEDDCVPSINFFSYCNYCLEEYKNDQRVMQIAGNNYTENNNYTNDDYLFSKYGHIWGWATWKRAWNHFDYSMREWPIFRNNNYLQNCSNSVDEYNYLLNIFNYYYNDPLKPWAIRWLFAKIKMGGLSIVPRINLIKNIGDIGTNSLERYSYSIDLKSEFKMNDTPLFVIVNNRYDLYHFNNHINDRYNLIQKASRSTKRIINKILTH
jgi:hypothetical protein